jgi:hypothetical protein
MAIIDQLVKSNFSLDGPSNLSNRDFGYFDPNLGTKKLHNNYSIYSNPNVKIMDFNGNVSVRPESTLDELDSNAPNNTTPGVTIYKSASGQNYKDKGPIDGKY